jgi:hypothetical protein
MKQGNLSYQKFGSIDVNQTLSYQILWKTGQIQQNLVQNQIKTDMNVRDEIPN